jgi:polysaccharide biosynthesis transport protein
VNETPYIEEEIHLRDYLRVIGKRKRLIAAFTLVVLALVVVGTLLTVPVFTASTKLLIERNEKDPLTNATYRYSDPEFVETQNQIIKSLSVSRKVVGLLNLESQYDTLTGKDPENESTGRVLKNWITGAKAAIIDFTGVSRFLRGGAEASEEEKNSPEMSREEELARILSEGIEVKPVRNSRVVSIEYEAESPELAKRIVDAVSQGYIDEMLEMRLSASAETIRWMTQKADEERKRLEKSENALQEYMRQQNILTVEDRVAIVPQKLAELSTEMTQAQAKREQLEVLRDAARGAGKGSQDAEAIPAVAANEGVQAIRRQMREAEQKIEDMAKKFGPKHPLMQRAKADLDLLVDKKQQEVRRVLKSIEAEYEIARRTEENLNALLSNTKNDAAQLNEKFVQYGILKREIDSNRILYDALIKKIKEQSITDQAQTVNIWVMESAKTPDGPSNRRVPRNLMLALVLGLFGGVGLAFFFEYLDNSVKAAEDAENTLGTPVLGTVGLLKQKDQNIDKVILETPRSTFAENYRAIRTSLLLSSADGPPKSLVVTSTFPEDGKTATAVNLALALAQSDQKVLLVDGDLRKPRIHKILNLENKVGLSTYLSSPSDVQVIQKGPVENLKVMTSGPHPPNPSELLGSKRMASLIEAFKNTEKFDMVIFDSPPILSVTDGLIISKAVEGTILVVRSGKTTYDTAAKGLKTLQDVQAKVLGLVVNGVDLKKSKYYYYDRYRYAGAYYGEETEVAEGGGSAKD